MGKNSVTSTKSFLRLWPVPAAIALIALPFLAGWWRLERLNLPAGEEIRAEARIAPGGKPVHIGDPVPYTVVVRARSGHQISRPNAPKSDERFELRLVSETGNQRILGGVRREFRYELRPFAAGRLRIGPSRAKASRSGRIATAATNAVTLTVQSLLPKDPKKASLREAKPPLNLPIDYRMAALVLLAPIALTLLILELVRWLRKRSALCAAKTAAVPAAEPAHLLAFRELEALRSELAGPAEPFFVRLSCCLRTYLLNRYGLKAPELTTEELLPLAAQELELPAGAGDGLACLARLWDAVKFARHEPAAGIAADALRQAVDFVELTKDESPADKAGAEEGRAS